MVSGELLWTDDVVTDLLEKASGDLQIRISLPSTRCWGSKQSNTVFLHPYPIDPMFDIFGHLLTPSFGCFTPLWHGLYGLISWYFPNVDIQKMFPRPRSCSKCSSHPTRDPPGSSLGRWSHEERHLEVTRPAVSWHSLENKHQFNVWICWTSQMKLNLEMKVVWF